MEPGNESGDGAVTPQQVVDYLVYANYAHNRRIAPDVTPKRWEKVYGPSVWEMEEQFQRETALESQRNLPEGG